MNLRKIGLSTAVSLVIANMIGTGVFTSLGYQLGDTKNVFALMMLWVVGGIMALCGALVYGEIGSVYPNSGGEYNYLSKIYHPSVGFLAGWISGTVGFAAPIAMAAMSLAVYAKGVFPELNSNYLAVGVIVVVTILHSFNLKTGSTFQRIVTFLKVGIILFLIVAGFLSQTHETISLAPGPDGWTSVFSGTFAVALFFVTYSYSGWNAAAYMAGEIENPQKNLPKSLLIGTIIVTLIYVLLNFIFLYSAPMQFITGKQEVGLISSIFIFGPKGGNIMGMLISFLLISAVSSMVMAGPRVLQSMGKDVKLLGFFAKTNKNEIPVIAIVVQSTIAITLVLTAKFEFVLNFTAFSLNIFTMLTVFGVFIVRYKNKSANIPYKTFLYPLPAILFLIFQLWIVYFGFKLKPTESFLGLINIGIGFIFWLVATYFFDKKINIKKT